MKIFYCNAFSSIFANFITEHKLFCDIELRIFGCRMCSMSSSAGISKGIPAINGMDAEVFVYNAFLQIKEMEICYEMIAETVKQIGSLSLFY